MYTRRPKESHRDTNVASAAVSSYWTPERLELKAWMTRYALSLAELYEGAVRLIFEIRLAGIHSIRWACFQGDR